MLLLLLCECGRCPKIFSSKPRKVLLIIAGTTLILAGGPPNLHVLAAAGVATEIAACRRFVFRF